MGNKRVGKILIIQLDQFGYLTDTLKWCEYLRDNYQITVVCYDSKKKRFDIPNVKVRYVQLSSNRIIHAFRFIIAAVLKALFFSGKIIVVAFPHCDVIKRLLPWKKMHLDIRTVSVSRNEEARRVYDKKLQEYGHLYDSVTVISDGVRDRLQLPEAQILPLGSDIVSTKEKDYTCMNLLYVGTLKGRDIDKTIKGVYLFLKKYPNVSLVYDIIGDAPDENGTGKMSEKYKDLIISLGIEKNVIIHGAKSYNELKPFMDKASYGVSFVPMTPWYDVQPPTKTFEYAMSGLFVIATGTSCNKKIVNSSNGLIINDTSEDFMVALETINSNCTTYNEDLIRESLSEYSWSNIVSNVLEPLLKG